MRVITKLEKAPFEDPLIRNDNDKLQLTLEKLRDKCLLVLPEGHKIEWLLSGCKNASRLRIALECLLADFLITTRSSALKAPHLVVATSNTDQIAAALNSPDFKALESAANQTPVKWDARDDSFRRTFQGLVQSSSEIEIIDKWAGKNLNASYSGATWLLKQLLELQTPMIRFVTTIQGDPKSSLRINLEQRLETGIRRALGQANGTTKCVEVVFCESQSLGEDEHPRQLVFKYENSTCLFVATDHGTENFKSDPLKGTPQISVLPQKAAVRFRQDVLATANSIWRFEATQKGMWHISKS